MRFSILYITAGLVALFAACSNESVEPMSNIDEKSKIYLRAATSVDGYSESRIPYELENPTTDVPLNAEVWATTTRRVYANEHKEDGSVIADGSGPDGKVARHATARFQSSNPQLLNAAIYNKDALIPVYFVAFHPHDNWQSNAANNIATYNFSGYQDVMFADERSGVYATDYSQSPQLLFKHLLTWFKIEIRAENEEVAIAWGDIKSITIKSKSSVSIDLSKVYSVNECVDFTNETSLNFYHTGTDDVYPGTTPLPIPYTGFTEVAYTMCAPVMATTDDLGDRTTEYVITIETTNRPNVTVNVDLKDGADSWFGGSTMGRMFTLKLNFKMGNTITVAATAQRWKTAGIGNIIIDEE